MLGPCLSSLHLPKIIERLHPRGVGHIVTNVEELIITYGSSVFIALIHACAKCEVKRSLWLRFFSKESFSLHDGWYFGICYVQPGGRHVDVADDSINCHSWFFSGP